MDKDEEKSSTGDPLIDILIDSGFRIVPIQTVIDALASMEQYIMEMAGVSQEELDMYLQKIEDLVGKEEAFRLELEEIVSWIQAFRQS